MTGVNGGDVLEASSAFEAAWMRLRVSYQYLSDSIEGDVFCFLVEQAWIKCDVWSVVFLF